MSDDLVPFGKHRGQPLEVLMADREYLEWLMAQPWFAAKYQKVYNIVINYGSTESASPPEHNAMQARFLDEGIRKSVAVKLLQVRSTLDKEQDLILDSTTTKFIFEHKGWDVVLKASCQQRYMGYLDDYTGGIDPTKKTAEKLRSYDTYAYMELKPSIGDDYPAILRNIKKRLLSTPSTNREIMLLADIFQSQVVSLDQSKEFFGTSGVVFLLWEELISAINS